MSLGFSTALRTAIAQTVLDAIDGGPGVGTLKIYGGVRPSTGGTATNLLATFSLVTPSGVAAAGVATIDADPDLSTTWSGTGTATWFRVETSAGTFIMDGGVGTSGADLNLSSVSADGASTVVITDGTIIVGNN